MTSQTFIWLCGTNYYFCHIAKAYLMVCLVFLFSSTKHETKRLCDDISLSHFSHSFYQIDMCYSERQYLPKWSKSNRSCITVGCECAHNAGLFFRFCSQNWANPKLRISQNSAKITLKLSKKNRKTQIFGTQKKQTFHKRHTLIKASCISWRYIFYLKNMICFSEHIVILECNSSIE